MMPDERIDKLLTMLGHAVASALADTRLEIFALRQMLAEHETLSEQELDLKIAALPADKLPTLTASTSKDIGDRSWKLREQMGLA